MVLSVPAVAKSRYYAVQFEDGNTFNFGYIGSRSTGDEAGDYMVVGPGLEGETRRHQEGVPFHHAVLVGGLPHPTLQSGRHAQCDQDAGRLQGAAALGVSEAAGPTRGTGGQFPEDRRGDGEDELLRIPRFPVAIRPAWPEEKEIRAKLARLGIGAGKNFDFKALPPSTRPQWPGHEGRRRPRSTGISPGRRTSTVGRSAPGLATAHSSTATGCCAPPVQRGASTATTRSRRRIP